MLSTSPMPSPYTRILPDSTLPLIPAYLELISSNCPISIIKVFFCVIPNYCKFSMLFQVPVFTMDRHEVLRFDKLMHQLKLFLAHVTS
nr:hypothetical protein [Pseudobacteroides cellulosolvens]